MKKVFAILTLAVASLLGMSLASCTKLQPTEITAVARPITAHAMFTFQFSGSTPIAVPAGSEAIFTITDGSTVYQIRKAVEKGGMVELEIGCGTSGVSVVASMQAKVADVGGTKWAYGSESVNLTASNKYFASKTVTVN